MTDPSGIFDRAPHPSATMAADEEQALPLRSQPSQPLDTVLPQYKDQMRSSSRSQPSHPSEEEHRDDVLLPHYKDQMRSSNTGPSASAVDDKVHPKNDAALVGEEEQEPAAQPTNVPIMYGQLVEETAEQPQQPGDSASKDVEIKEESSTRRHRIWAVALVIVVIVVAIIAAVVVVAGVGGGDTFNSIVTVYYVQIVLFPISELLAGTTLDNFQVGTTNFYQKNLPDTVTDVASKLLDQSFQQEQELSTLVQIDGTTAEDAALDPLVFAKAILDHKDEYLDELSALDTDAFGQVTEVNAIAAEAPVDTTPRTPVTDGTDVCGNAVAVTPLDDQTATVAVGSTVNANPPPTEDNLFNGSPAVYYQWTTPAGLHRRIRISTCTPETDFPTALYVSSSNCRDDVLGPLRWSSAEEDLDCEFGSQAATVSFRMEPAKTYYLAVAGRNPENVGTFGLSLTRFVLIANDECDNAMTTVPLDDSADPLFTADTTLAQPASDDRFNGSPTLHYKFSIVGLNRRVRISTCAPETNFPTAIYVSESTCDSHGARFIKDTSEPDYDCDPTGNAASVSFVAAVGKDYTVVVSGRKPTDVGTFGFSLTRFALVENDECANAKLITPKNDDPTALFNASTALAQPTSDDRFNGSPTLNYKFSIVGLNRRVRISTCAPETNFPTVIYVSESTCDRHGARFIKDTSEPDYGCDPTGNAASLSFVAAVGKDYTVVVAGRRPTDVGTFGISLIRHTLVENDECDNAQMIFPMQNDTSTLLVASTDLAQPASDDRFNGSPIVYYQFSIEAGQDQPVYISTCAPETNFPTVIYVTKSTCDRHGARFITDTSEADFTCDPSGNAGTVEFVAEVGKNYIIGVAGRQPTETGIFGLVAYYLPGQ